MTRLTADQARRTALAAQGFGTRPRKRVGQSDLRRLIAKIHVLQLDSVSVAVRAHYAPVFSRLGPYDRDVLDGAAWGSDDRLLVEYWAHEAALMPVVDWPLFRWRMGEFVHGRWGVEIVRDNPALVDAVVAAVAELGPSTAGQIEAHVQTATPRGKGAWWNRSHTKWVAEALFAAGVFTTAHRVGFARYYDLAERVLPADVLARAIDTPDALRTLTLRASSALGVATEADLRDYFRLRPAEVRPAIAALVQAGELEPVEVDGWATPTYFRAGQPIPRTNRATALLCPFDPLIFFRPRVQRLFGFEYRIEIYTPAAKRRYGYYVWPFLLDGHLVGRVDLKSDRAAGTLRVIGAFAEPGRDKTRVAENLASELTTMAGWLGLPRLTVEKNGDLASALGRCL